MKNKIKSYGDEATGFHDKEMKVDSDYTCLIVITIDSALEKRWKALSTSGFKIM